jgi:hypothetical protein
MVNALRAIKLKREGQGLGDFIPASGAEGCFVDARTVAADSARLEKVIFAQVRY